MNAALLLLTLTAFLGTAPSRLDPARFDDHAQASTESPKDIVRGLAQRTKHLKAFTANYRGTSKSGEFTLRLAYKSPGDGYSKVDLVGGSMTYWILNGHFFFQVNDPENPARAEFDYPAALADGSGFDQAFEREFPSAPSGPDDLSAGARFQLEPHLKDSTKSFDIAVDWITERDHFLTWLKPAEWADAKRVGEELVRTLDDGTTVALSTNNGFIRRIQRPDGFHLDLVDFKESADDADFVVPKPKPEMRDAMPGVFANKTQVVEFLRRLMIFWRMSSETDTASDAFKGKLTRVFVVLFTPELTAQSERVDKDRGTHFDEFATWSGRRFKETAGDPAARKGLESNIAERRALYAKKLAEEFQYHALDRSRLEGFGLKPELIARITDIEQAAYDDAVQRIVSAPFLAKFDEAIAKAESSK